MSRLKGPPIFKVAAQSLPRATIEWNELIVDERDNSRLFYEDSDIEELAEDITQRGLINPLVVSVEPGGRKFRLIAGFRRCRAITLLREIAVRRQHDELPFDEMEVAVVQERGLARDLYNIAENHQKPISIIEMGRYIRRLMEKHQIDDVALIAKKCGRSASYIYNCLAVVDQCVPEITRALERGLEHHEFTGGKQITRAQIFRWARMAPKKQREEFERWTGTLGRGDRAKRQPPKTVNPVRLRTYLDKIRDLDIVNPSVRAVRGTLEWVLKERPSPPIRVTQLSSQRQKLL